MGSRPDISDTRLIGREVPTRVAAEIVGMEEVRTRSDLTAMAWCRGDKRKRRRLVAAAALGLCVRGGREARKSRMQPLALEARQIMFAFLLFQSSQITSIYPSL